MNRAERRRRAFATRLPGSPRVWMRPALRRLYFEDRTTPYERRSGNNTRYPVYYGSRREQEAVARYQEGLEDRAT